MNVRLRRLVAVSCVGLGAAIAACSGNGGPGGAVASSAVEGEYKGELSGPGLTGVLEVTFGGGGSAPSAVHVVDTQDQESAAGTLTLSDGSAFQLAGTFDPDTETLSIAGGGYAFNGTLNGEGFSGTYAGPSSSGSFALVKGSGAVVLCGAYSGQDTGVWNLVVGPSSASGSIASDGGTVTSSLACTVSGASLSCKGSNGIVADGTISGSSASGQWHDGKGNGGAWTGGTGRCPVPGPHRDAGAQDAGVTVDAGGTQGTGAAADSAGAQDTGVVADAGGAQDAGAPDDGGASADVSNGVDASAVADASGGSDGAVAADATSGGDAALDAGPPLDAGGIDAASCALVTNVTAITAAVPGPNPKAITQLGMGTGNYPIEIVTSAVICPGTSVVQISTKSATWSDVGTCAGSAAGDSICDGIVIPSADLSFPAQVQLRVVNPGQAAGTAYSFYVFQGSPSPVITGPATGSLVAGGGAQMITLSGTGLTGATVECDFAQDGGVAVVPGILQATSNFMTLQFPASFTATPQPAFWTKVTVSSPVGGVAYWALKIDVQ